MSFIPSAFLSAGLNQLLDFLTKKFDEIKPKDVQVVNVKTNPLSFSVTEIDKVTTIETKFRIKDKPNLEFENPLEDKSIVKEIVLTPDTLFKTKGKVLVTIDDSVVFKSKSFTAFEDVIESKIPINKTISKDSKVKIFLRSSDASVVGITTQVTFED